jgi:hypothetical protein
MMINEDIQTEGAGGATSARAVMEQQVEPRLIRHRQQMSKEQNYAVAFQRSANHPNGSLVSEVSTAAWDEAADQGIQPADGPVGSGIDGSSAHATDAPHAPAPWRPPLNEVNNTLNQSSARNDANHTAQPVNNQLHLNDDGRRCPSNGGNAGYRCEATSLFPEDDGGFRDCSIVNDDGIGVPQTGKIKPTAAEVMAECKFPSGDKDDSSSLRRRIAEVVQDKRGVDPHPKRRTKKRKRADGNCNNMVDPIVTCVRFDSRFLEYDRAANGQLKMEKLVKKASFSRDAIRDYDRGRLARIAPDHFIEEIPDEPRRSQTASRVGPLYQALLPGLEERVNLTAKLELDPLEQVFMYAS